jgi:hypothetical protein
MPATRSPRRATGSIQASRSAATAASSAATAERDSKRKRLTSVPVSISTGQAMAHIPSAAQVSTAS